MADQNKYNLTETAALLFTKLSMHEQDSFIALLKSLLSEQQSSSAVPPLAEQTER